MNSKRFLKDSDNTGRFIVKSKVTGKKYFVEVVGNTHSADWGDLDPATKKMTGSYGERYEGCIPEKDSLITEENGFEKITTLPAGVSPFDEIEKRDKEYERKMNELSALEEEFNEK
jgi:hypothetical protein